MTTPSRTEAQGRADEIRVFHAELERLQRDGVLALGEEQRGAVKMHHAAVLADLARSRPLPLLLRIAGFLGVVALVAAVSFPFYRYWPALPATAQVLVLVVAALATFAATAWLAGRDRTGYFARLAALVAFACFVLDLALLGPIFNVTPSYTVLLYWAALALLLAYRCEARLLLACGLLCLGAWIGARAGAASGGYWLYFGARPENFLPAAALFAVPFVFDQRRFEGFAQTWHVFGLLALFLPMLVLAHWGRASYLHYAEDSVQRLYQALGFALAAACIGVGLWRRWRHIVSTGATFLVIFLFAELVHGWLRGLIT